MPTERYVLDGWTVVRTIMPGQPCTYEYSRTHTMSGAAENLDLSIPYPFRLNRIVWESDDATAKSFTERIISNSITDQIASFTADTNTFLSASGEEADKYTTLPIIIRSAISASTAGKTLAKKVNVTRLG